HTMNAWEDGERIHCEVIEFPRPPFFPGADGSPAPSVEGRLARWTINLADNSKQVRHEPIDDLNAEMPRFDERFAGMPYRHGWYMANVGGKIPMAHNALVHIDFRTGRRSIHVLEPTDVAGEP